MPFVSKILIILGGLICVESGLEFWNQIQVHKCWTWDLEAKFLGRDLSGGLFQKVMVHGDDKGLVLPPYAAGIQAPSPLTDPIDSRCNTRSSWCPWASKLPARRRKRRRWLRPLCSSCSVSGGRSLRRFFFGVRCPRTTKRSCWKRVSESCWMMSWTQLTIQGVLDGWISGDFQNTWLSLHVMWTPISWTFCPQPRCRDSHLWGQLCVAWMEVQPMGDLVRKGLSDMGRLVIRLIATRLLLIGGFDHFCFPSFAGWSWHFSNGLKAPTSLDWSGNLDLIRTRMFAIIVMYSHVMSMSCNWLRVPTTVDLSKCGRGGSTTSGDEGCAFANWTWADGHQQRPVHDGQENRPGSQGWFCSWVSLEQMWPENAEKCE